MLLYLLKTMRIADWSKLVAEHVAVERVVNTGDNIMDILELTPEKVFRVLKSVLESMGKGLNDFFPILPSWKDEYQYRYGFNYCFVSFLVAGSRHRLDIDDVGPTITRLGQARRSVVRNRISQSCTESVSFVDYASSKQRILSIAANATSSNQVVCFLKVRELGDLDSRLQGMYNQHVHVITPINDRSYGASSSISLEMGILHSLLNSSHKFAVFSNDESLYDIARSMGRECRVEAGSRKRKQTEELKRDLLEDPEIFKIVSSIRVKGDPITPLSSIERSYPLTDSQKRRYRNWVVILSMPEISSFLNATLVEVRRGIYHLVLLDRKYGSCDVEDPICHRGRCSHVLEWLKGELRDECGISIRHLTTNFHNKAVARLDLRTIIDWYIRNGLLKAKIENKALVKLQA